MTLRSLFLLGGAGALAATAPEWLARTGGEAARLVVLSCGAGCRKYMPVYTDHWPAQFVGPDENGVLDVAQATALISGATGIFVAGGETELYHSLYGVGPLRELIRARYAAGVAYAGLSAGALLAMDTCVLYPPDVEGIARLPGLGLLPDTLVGVHFTEQGGLDAFLPVVRRVVTTNIWGIDDDACLLFENEVLSRSLGGDVYELDSVRVSGLAD